MFVLRYLKLFFKFYVYNSINLLNQLIKWNYLSQRGSSQNKIRTYFYIAKDIYNISIKFNLILSFVPRMYNKKQNSIIL